MVAMEIRNKLEACALNYLEWRQSQCKESIADVHARVGLRKVQFSNFQTIQSCDAWIPRNEAQLVMHFSPDGRLNWENVARFRRLGLPFIPDYWILQGAGSDIT